MSQKKGAKGGKRVVLEQQNPAGWKNPDRKSWAEAKQKGGGKGAWPGA